MGFRTPRPSGRTSISYRAGLGTGRATVKAVGSVRFEDVVRTVEAATVDRKLFKRADGGVRRVEVR